MILHSYDAKNICVNLLGIAEYLSMILAAKTLVTSSSIFDNSAYVFGKLTLCSFISQLTDVTFLPFFINHIDIILITDSGPPNAQCSLT